jgi:hypothetical protein
MKKSFLMLAASFAFLSGSAQINLNKLKEKAENATKKEKDKPKDKKTEESKAQNTQVETKSTDTKTTDKKADAPAKANIESSPAAASIRKYRNALSFAKDAVEKPSDDAASRVDGLKPMLDKIKQEDPNWPEYEKDEAAYLDLKKKLDKSQEVSGMQNTVEQFQRAMWLIEGEPQVGFQNIDIIKKEHFEELKKYYEENPQQSSDYTKKVFTNADNFYATTVPGVKTNLIAQIDNVLKFNTNYIKETRSKNDYLKQLPTQYFDPKPDIEKMDACIKLCENVFLMLPHDAECMNRKKLCEERKTDLESYVNSGQYDKDLATKKQMDIDERVLEDGGMKDAQVMDLVKREMPGMSNGTVQRIVIVSPDWNISRNDFGIILSKGVPVQAAITSEGKCYVAFGYATRDYDGANYGKPYFSYQGKAEMNCNNVNK